MKAMNVSTVLIAVMILWQASLAKAQGGRLLKEGVEATAKKLLGRAATETSQEATEQAFKKAASAAIREAGQESIEAAARKSGTALLRHSDEIAKAASVHGAAIAAPIVNKFGDAGATALIKLSPTSARRMAMLADDLAAGGRGADWMKVISRYGDGAAEWIWWNKGTVAVATTATAFLANPEAFLQAGEVVASNAIEAAGEHVAHPLIEGTVTQLAPQVAKEIARPAVALAEASGRSPLTLFLVLTVISCVGAWGCGRLPYFRSRSR